MPKCLCGCGEEAKRGRYHTDKCRLRKWQRDVLVPQLLAEMDEDTFRHTIKAECIRRWGAGRLRVRFGGGG